MWTLVFTLRRCRLKTPIRTVSDVNAWIIFREGICQHSCEHQAEQRWVQNTALLDTICDFKGSGLIAVIKNVGLHAIMKLTHHVDES